MFQFMLSLAEKWPKVENSKEEEILRQYTRGQLSQDISCCFELS